MPMSIPKGLCFRKETAGVPGNAPCSSSKQIQSSLNGLDGSGRRWRSDPLWVPSGRKKRMKVREIKLFRPTVNLHHKWVPAGSHHYTARRSKFWSHVPTAPKDGEWNKPRFSGSRGIVSTNILPALIIPPAHSKTGSQFSNNICVSGHSMGLTTKTAFKGW